MRAFGKALSQASAFRPLRGSLKPQVWPGVSPSSAMRKASRPGAIRSAGSPPMPRRPGSMQPGSRMEFSCTT